MPSTYEKDSSQATITATPIFFIFRVPFHNGSDAWWRSYRGGSYRKERLGTAFAFFPPGGRFPPSPPPPSHAFARLVIDPRFRTLKKEDRYFSVESGGDEPIVDFADYLLGSRCRRPKVDLGSRQAIHEYAKRYIAMDAALIRSLGYTDHVEALAARYGGEAFIAVHLPSMICEIFDPLTGYTGFEPGLEALVESPEGMRCLIEVCYELQLEWARAYAAAGAHAFIISETYISPDIAGPAAYPRFLKAVHRDFFREVERMGLVPICDFWGDAMPLLEELAQANIRGLMVEESKKTFTLDIREIRRRIGDRLCVFGNLDSLVLLHDGPPEAIRAEVQRQAAEDGRAGGGAFIAANGSPITPGTPEENVRALIAAARGLKGGAAA